MRLVCPGVRQLIPVGPGGIGKTQLALHVAPELRTRFAHGVCFVWLAPLSDPELVPQVTGQQLGYRGPSELLLIDQAKCNLPLRLSLLTLDKSRHLLAGSSASILVTSSAVLHEQGAQEFLCLLSPCHIFPAFHETSENRRTSASICTRLDGLPLGIELAAQVKSCLCKNCSLVSPAGFAY